jgi:hypothetical protein
VTRKLVRRVLVPMWYIKILPNPTRRNFSKNLNKNLPLLLRRRTRKRKKISLVASLGTMLESVRRLSESQTRKQQRQLRVMQEQRDTIIYCPLFFQFVIHQIGVLIQELRLYSLEFINQNQPTMEQYFSLITN